MWELEDGKRKVGRLGLFFSLPIPKVPYQIKVQVKFVSPEVKIRLKDQFVLKTWAFSQPQGLWSHMKGDF